MSKQSRSQPGAAVPGMPQAIGDGGQTAADWSSTPAAIAAQPAPARANKTIFAILSAVCLLVAAGYIGWAVLRGQSPRNGAGDAAVPVVEGDSASIALLAKQPHVLFQSQSAAPNTDGHRVALSTLDGLSGPRTLTPAQCQRVYYAGGQGLCVGVNDGVTTSDRAYTFGDDFQPRHSLQLSGFPSRARVSPDGRYGAMTEFVAGHSYAEAGFSTLTTLIDMPTGKIITDLEKFEVFRDGTRIASPDFNFWGVTFARDSNRFYATLGTGGKTYLVEGDVSARRVRVLRENVECPSLSPDNKRIAFKKRDGSLGMWRLHILDLATLEDKPLEAETRIIDDQVEWLDDNQILYRWGQDVIVLPTDGSAPPRIFLARASSPAVVR